MNRTLAVVKVHLLDPHQAYWPWAIMVASLLVNMALWVALANLPGYSKTTGGLASLYITALVIAAISVYQKLPFVAGLGAARRTFLRGTLIFGLGFAAASGILLLALNRLEAATGGFGLGGSFFRIEWWTQVSAAELIGVYAVPMVLMLVLGAALGGIVLRYGTRGLFITMLGFAVLGAAVVLLVGATHAWPSIRSWISDLTPLSLTAWLVAPTVAAGAATWGTLRRVPL
jgi:hypothetical protein